MALHRLDIPGWLDRTMRTCTDPPHFNAIAMWMSAALALCCSKCIADDEFPLSALAESYAAIPCLSMTAQCERRIEPLPGPAVLKRRQNLLTVGHDFRFASMPVLERDRALPGILGRKFEISAIDQQLQYIDFAARQLEIIALPDHLTSTVPFASETPALLTPFEFLGFKNGEMTGFGAIHWRDIMTPEFLSAKFRDLKAVVSRKPLPGIECIITFPYRDLDIPKAETADLAELPSRIAITIVLDNATGLPIVSQMEWRPQGTKPTYRCEYHYAPVAVAAHAKFQKVPMLASSQTTRMLDGVSMLSATCSVTTSEAITVDDLRIDPFEAKTIHDQASGKFLSP